MKKTIFSIILSLTAFAALSPFSAKAQTSSYEQKRVLTYVKASVSLNRFTVDNALLSTINGYEGLSATVNPKLGYDIVVGFQYRPVQNLGFYLAMDAGIGTRGTVNTFSSTIGGSGVEVMKETVLTHNIKVSPLQIGYRFNISNVISIDPHVGGYVSYDFAGKERVDALATGLSVGAEIDIKDDGNYNRFDAGINPGIALWFGPFGIDFTYQRGFVNANKGRSEGAFTQNYSENFIIGLALRF